MPAFRNVNEFMDAHNIPTISDAANVTDEKIPAVLLGFKDSLFLKAAGVLSEMDDKAIFMGLDDMAKYYNLFYHLTVARSARDFGYNYTLSHYAIDALIEDKAYLDPWFMTRLSCYDKEDLKSIYISDQFKLATQAYHLVRSLEIIDLMLDYEDPLPALMKSLLAPLFYEEWDKINEILKDFELGLKGDLEESYLMYIKPIKKLIASHDKLPAGFVAKYSTEKIKRHKEVIP